MEISEIVIQTVCAATTGYCDSYAIAMELKTQEKTDAICLKELVGLTTKILYSTALQN